MTQQEVQATALDRARNGQALTNYPSKGHDVRAVKVKRDAR